MLFGECIISKYGRTCISNNRLPINNIMLYLMFRTVENIIKKYIHIFTFEFVSKDIDIDYIAFT